MPSHTASAIVLKTVPISHDLEISGYSSTKSYYSNGTYRSIKSAKFVAGGRSWYLRYYPSGCSQHNRLITFLLYHDRDNGAEEDKVAVSYQITLLGPDGNPVAKYQCSYDVTYDDEKPSSIYGPIGLISRTDLEQSGYLWDDAFSVRCEFDVPIIVSENTVMLPSEPEEPMPTHVPTDVHGSLLRVFSEEVPVDVALEVGDETFKAHRRFLTAQSPVFAALFAGPMRENTAPSLRIDNMEPPVFKAMLDFIYRGNLHLPSPVNDDEGDDQIAMTQHLLVAADRYDLERLKSICEEKLRRHIKTSTMATTLDLAHRHGCHALKDACYDFLAPYRGNFKAILNGEAFEQLVKDFPSVVVELLDRVSPSPL